MSNNIWLDYTKEAKRQITHHKQQVEYWENILNKIINKTEEKSDFVSNSHDLNDLKYLYFSDEILAQDRIKRAGFWLRSKEAIKIINELQDSYGIKAIFPRANNKQEPLMFSGLYIHYASWLGEEAVTTAKLQIWEALRNHCIELETVQLTFGDIATIMGVII